MTLDFTAGFLLEKSDRSVTPFSMVNIGGPYAVKGMMANPLSSPQYWKPSTFGGQVGFDIVKSASIEKLFCNNMKAGECDQISFYVPKQNKERTSQFLEPSLRKIWTFFRALTFPSNDQPIQYQSVPSSSMQHVKKSFNCNPPDSPLQDYCPRY